MHVPSCLAGGAGEHLQWTLGPQTLPLLLGAEQQEDRARQWEVLRNSKVGTGSVIVWRAPRTSVMPRVLGPSWSPSVSSHLCPRLVPAHPALVNAIVLVLHSVAGSTPLPGADSSSRSATSSSYRDMPGGPQGSVT